VLSIVSSDRPMCCLCLEVTFRRDQIGRHEPQTSIALGHNVALDVSIVVLARPHKPSLALDHLGHHVVDQSVLVPEVLGIEVLFVGGLVDGLKDVFKEPVILLENGVLGAQIQRVVLVECIFEAGMGEALDGFFRVVHAEETAFTLEVVYFNFFSSSMRGFVD